MRMGIAPANGIDLVAADPGLVQKLDLAEDFLLGDRVLAPPPPDKGSGLGRRILEFGE